MEEQKKTKEIEMGTANQDNNATHAEKMPTFDELYKAYMDLANKHQIALQRLQQADKYIQTFNRLDYLFKVMEIVGNYRDSSDYPCFASDFVEDCIKEIQDTMTIPEETEQSESKGN